MASVAFEKRKNDERRAFPWWLLLLVGFGLGIVFTLGMSMGRGGAVSVYSSESIPDNLAAQATQIIAEATLNARAAQNNFAAESVSDRLDPLLMTATAFIQEATRQAANSMGSS